MKSSWLFNLCADGMVRDVNARVRSGGLKLVDGIAHGWELNQLLFAYDTAVVQTQREICAS